MSAELEENTSHIGNVDVILSAIENDSMTEITTDSGFETTVSYSGAHPVTSVFDTLSEDTLQIEQKGSSSIDENESDSLLSSSLTVSPEINDHADISCGKEFSLIKETVVSIAKDANFNICDEHSIVPDLINMNEIQVSSQPNVENKALNNVNSRALTSSTVSLNETNGIISNTLTSKSAFSRSAENISNTVINDISGNSIKENTDKILLDFMFHKNKVTATQKVPENPQSSIDLSYARIPKELLPQDLGSIVKNVHGIFSTVSGSLKNAYNNTHRISIQKAPAKPIVKPIPNGKVMNDIFEDEIVEEKSESHNELETNDSSEILVTDTKIDENGLETDNDPKKDVLKMQVETLEKMLAEQRKENSGLREKVKQQLDELQEKDQSFKEFEVKLDLMSKRVEQAEREKDAAVMRYASVECAGIEARRVAEKATAAEKAALQEMEIMQGKIRTAAAEKQRICRLYDDKCHELAASEREVAKLREEQKEMEGRLKWTQSKLRMEMDAYKDSAERVEKLTQRISELEAGKEAAVANASDAARAKQLEAELKESQAALILCRHERDELDKRLAAAILQRDTAVRERDSANEALTRTGMEVEELKMRNLQLEEEAAELAALRAQAALADTLSAQLEREKEKCARAEASLAEAVVLAESCSQREACALEHAAAVTAQHVARSRDHTDAARMVQALTVDNASLRERIESLEAQCASLKTSLAEETERRNKENKVLARKVAELTEEVTEANKKLEWEKGENGVLKKKHASAIKELNRELQRSMKRCEQLEAKLPPPDSTSTRAGSVSSLSSAEGGPTQSSDSDALPQIQAREPDRQALIERIVSLQRQSARRLERCEFLEEHARQLTQELRAKAALLRALVPSLPTHALADAAADTHKKEIAKLGGGVMAALWGGDPNGMTLELSLEMNKRLQALLEDTLLKNITLKQNMDTLGAEISRLKGQKNPPETK